MTMTELRDYATAAEEDRASWLGQMFVYSVTDTKVKHDLLAEKMRDGGLDDYVPDAPKDENVWRRVFTDGVRRTIRIPGELEERVMIRLVSRKDGQIVKHVVIETVDANGKKLAYQAVLEVTFDADNPHLTDIRPIGTAWHAEAWALANHLREEYWAERGCVDGQAIRVVIRDVLEGCRATALRAGGGCYFTKTVHLPRIEALEAVGDVIPGTLIHTVPIIDTDKQRANLKKAFEMESQAKLDDLLQEMRTIVRGKEDITEKRAAAFARRAKEAKAKLAEYQAILNDGLTGVDAKLGVFDVMYLQVLQQVKA